MLSVVTGAAGFIGSTLCDALVARGDDVVGIDCFTDYYDVALKRRNISALQTHERFTLADADLRTADLVGLLEGADAVFHQAGQPGVRLSWTDGFPAYDSHNIAATHRLLEACLAAGSPRLIYASSSSIYGNAARYPCDESDLPDPFSPYGVTKLAGEHLCRAYAANHGLATTVLRYFTVYGPRQRPDMAFHRLIAAGLGHSEPFPLYGDGSAVRDFTYVGDVVAANLAASSQDSAPGEVFNVAGGGSVQLAELIELAGTLLGRPIPVDRQDAVVGDVARTGGAIDKASRGLGWSPEVTIEQGLAAQIAWQRTEFEPSPAKT